MEEDGRSILRRAVEEGRTRRDLLAIRARAVAAEATILSLWRASRGRRRP